MKQANTFASVAALSVMILGLLGLSNIVASTDQPSNNLFVMTAPQAQIMPLAQHKDTYQIKLSGLQPMVTYFSDRPQRFAGTTSIDEFLKIWQDNKLNTHRNRPNVSLVSYSPGENSAKVYVFELKQPKFDAKTGSIAFNAKAIGESKPAANRTTELQQASLFVDDIGWHGNKFKPHHHNS